MNTPKQDLQDFARGILDNKATALQAKALMPDRRNTVEVSSMASPVNLPASVPPMGRRNGGGRPSNAGAIPAGAFHTLVTITSGAGSGDIHLQGGTVNGEDVTTTSLKLYDFGTDTWEGADDEQLYLTVTGTGVVADGVLLPGFTVSSITASIGSPPGDTPPTKDTPSGTAILSLGTFFNGGFLPAIAGNRNVAVCIGTFVKTVGA